MPNPIDIQKAGSATPPDAQYRGPGGFLSTPGLDRTVLSAYVTPSGLDEYLPARPSTVTNPLYAVFMGVTDESGTEPDDVCDDAPTVLMTAGHLTAQFGRIIRDSRKIDAGQLAATVRGQETDLALLARQGMGGSLKPALPGELDQAILTSAMRGAMFGVGEQFRRKYTDLLWNGDPANNDPSKPGYLEFPGLDLQITTGQVDALSGNSLSQLDSYVIDANFADIESYDIVAQMQDMEYQLWSRSTRMFNSAEHVIVMRRELWHKLTEIWPIQYNTQAVAHLLTSTGVALNVDGATLVNARDGMRQSQTLTINGRTYRVILDDGIYMHNSTHGSLGAGEFASTIYFVPLTANGFPVTEIEYMNFAQSDYNAFSELNVAAEVAVTDGGRYLWALVQNGYCFKWKARIEPRIILRAPHLAGKIQRVKWAPMSMPPSGMPSVAGTAEPYFSVGGTSLTTIPTDSAVWK